MEILPSSPGLSCLSSFLGSIQSEHYKKIDFTNLVISPICLLLYDFQTLLLTLIQPHSSSFDPTAGRSCELYSVVPTSPTNTFQVSSTIFCPHLTHSDCMQNELGLSSERMLCFWVVFINDHTQSWCKNAKIKYELYTNRNNTELNLWVWGQYFFWKRVSMISPWTSKQILHTSCSTVLCTWWVIHIENRANWGANCNFILKEFYIERNREITIHSYYWSSVETELERIHHVGCWHFQPTIPPSCL